MEDGLYTLDLSAYEGQLGYVAIRHFDCTDQFILNVDDITIVEGGGSLTWTEVSGISELSYTLSELTEGTNYYVQVQSDCGNIDGPSSWSKVTSFTTLTSASAPHEPNATDITATTAKLNWVGAQSSYNVRYSIAPEKTILAEGFESGTMPTGWSQNDTYWKITSGFRHILITPAMDLSDAESATLSFNFLNTNWDGDINTLKVYYRVNEGDWQHLYSYDQSTNGWIPVTINLRGMAASYQIGFECLGNYSYGMGIDDVEVIKTTNSTEWTTVNNVTSPQTITPLTPGKQYLWQVQGLDYDGNGSNTEWSETATFTTDYTSLTLYDSGASANSNSTTISDNNGNKMNVTLQGRTLYKDGDWNTLCLPFSVALEGSALEGATVLELDTDGSYDAEGTAVVPVASAAGPSSGLHQTGFASDGTLYLYFKKATSIVAGKPYIIKWADGDDIVNPTFPYSEIKGSSHETVTSEDGKVTFIGNFDPVVIEGNSYLYLGAANNLYYPSTDIPINAFRAYFQLNGITAADIHSQVKMFFGYDEDYATEVTTPLALWRGVGGEADDASYDLSGRKIRHSSFVTRHSSLPKGIYIHKGKKVVIK